MHERTREITGIIGGTSPEGLKIAKLHLQRGNGIVILDSKASDGDKNTVAVLAGRPREDGERVGQILFVEVDLNKPGTITEACKRAEGHFGQPINTFVNLTSTEFALPARPQPNISRSNS